MNLILQRNVDLRFLLVETSFIRQNVDYTKEYITTSSAHSNNVILAKAGSRMRKNSSKICPRVVDSAAVFVATEECQDQKKNIHRK